MTKESLWFLTALVGLMLWYRILFFIVPLYFKRPLTRSLLRLRWHHLHWGLLLILCGTILLLVDTNIGFAIVLLGIGLGFSFDLFIPSLLLETDREKELLVYRQSLRPTLLLFLIISAVVVVLLFLAK